MSRLATLAVAFLCASCLPEASSRNGVAVLVDVSKTYFENIDDALLGINYMLKASQARDYIAVGVIGDRSFSERSWAGSIQLEPVRTQRNAQIVRFASMLREHALLTTATNRTDIRGAVLSAQQKLEKLPVRRRILVLYSDLDDDPASDSTSRPMPDLSGVTVVLANVRPWAADNRDPRRFLQRKRHWHDWFTRAGAVRVVEADGEYVADYLK